MRPGPTGLSGLAMLLIAGCTSGGMPASSGQETPGAISFATVPEALAFIVDCVERNDVRKLTAACVGRGSAQAYLAHNPGVFGNIRALHARKDLRTLYGAERFPRDGTVFKLGGHGEQFHHIHIDFVKKGRTWRLADVWNCR